MQAMDRNTRSGGVVCSMCREAGVGGGLPVLSEAFSGSEKDVIHPEENRTTLCRGIVL